MSAPDFQKTSPDFPRQTREAPACQSALSLGERESSPDSGPPARATGGRNEGSGAQALMRPRVPPRAMPKHHQVWRQIRPHKGAPIRDALNEGQLSLLWGHLGKALEREGLNKWGSEGSTGAGHFQNGSKGYVLVPARHEARRWSPP